MNFLCRAIGFGLLILAGTFSGRATTLPIPVFPNLQNDPLYSRSTDQRLKDITVNVSWKQVELRTVLQDLTLMVRKTHPIHADINFRFSSSFPPAERLRPITLQLENSPVYEVLEYLGAQQANFTIKINKDLVLVFPKSP